MTHDKALETTVDILHRIRRGERVYLPYTEVVDLIKAVEEVRADHASITASSEAWKRAGVNPCAWVHDDR